MVGMETTLINRDTRYSACLIKRLALNSGSAALPCVDLGSSLKDEAFLPIFLGHCSISTLRCDDLGRNFRSFISF